MPTKSQPPTTSRRRPTKKSPWPLIILCLCLLLAVAGVAAVVLRLTAPPATETASVPPDPQPIHQPAAEPQATEQPDETAPPEPPSHAPPSRSRLSDSDSYIPTPKLDTTPDIANPRSARVVSAITRSPLAQPDDTFRRPLPLPRLDAGEEKPTAAPEGVIPWNQAHRYPGFTITVEGRVVVTRNTGHVCFLNFDKDWQGKFYVILFKDVLDAWPQPPQLHFKDKTIRVTGEVRLRSGTPQIQVEQPHQIVIVP